MLAAAALLCGLLAGWARGGGPGAMPFRWGWLAPTALALQLAAGYLDPPAPLRAGLVVGSFCLLLAFALANLAVTGVFLATVGMLMNFAVMAANGGRMPVDAGAARALGLDVAPLEQGTAGRHAGLVPETRLALLGDRIPLPLPWAPRVISPGDAVMVPGLFLLAQEVLGRPLRLGPAPDSAAGGALRLLAVFLISLLAGVALASGLG